MTKDLLLGWASCATPARRAAELLLVSSSLELGLAGVADRLVGAQFLVVAVDDTDTTSLGRAIEGFHASGGSARLCLAGRRKTLTRVIAAGFDNDQVGLMLDGVDTDTTYTDLIWDRIEAVRFKTDFVARAAKDLRTTLALESMLSLAREIGLCTLGDDPLPEGARVSGRYDFSYVPVVLGSDESDPPRSDATSLESPGHRVAPKSQAALRYP